MYLTTRLKHGGNCSQTHEDEAMEFDFEHSIDDTEDLLNESFTIPNADESADPTGVDADADQSIEIETPAEQEPEIEEKSLIEDRLSQTMIDEQPVTYHHLPTGSKFGNLLFVPTYGYVYSLLKELKSRSTVSGANGDTISSSDFTKTDNSDSAVLTSLSNMFNPVINCDGKYDDVQIVEEYLFTVGYEGCRDELVEFCSYVQSLTGSGSKSATFTKDAASLALRKKDVYQATAGAAGRSLVAPVSTVNCERGFSKQHPIKTCLRSSMAVAVAALDRLMKIAIDGLELKDFSFSKASKKWASKRTRRILN